LEIIAATAEQSLGNYSGNITIESNGGEPKQVNMNLIVSSEQPTVGSIYVTSDPSEASISLDGIYKGKTPITIDKVKEGSHIIKITKNRYEDYNVLVTVTAGETETVNANLVKQPGAIYVSSDPSEASISLDKVYKGRTPMTISKVSAGSHEIKITKPGYKDYNVQVTVTGGETETVNAKLVETGSISVRSSPSGANVYLDGSKKGVTTLLASKYDSRDSIIDKVLIDRDLAIDRNLVAIDGDLVIESPRVIYSLPKIIKGVSIGSHTIKITKSGYKDYTKQVNVRAGETTYVSAILTPITI